MPLALVTGASTGIGRATALHLAGSGWTVLAGVRSEAAAEALRDAAQGAPVQPITLDVTVPEQVAAAAVAVEEAGGRLDGLVNNAGIGVGGPLETIEPADLRRQFDVNFFGQIAVTQALLPALRRAGGRIVFISSIGGRVATPFTAPYGATKHAIEAVGDALRVELRSSNVRVILVEPGAVLTPIWDKAGADADAVKIPPELDGAYGKVPDALRKSLADTAKRGVPPERVAETIEKALTSPRPRARYLVGVDARMMLLLKRALPDRAFDGFIRRALGV